MLLWSPVFFACGVGMYFGLSFEPPLSLSLFALILVLILCVLFRFTGRFFLCLIVFGFASGHVRTTLVDAPMIVKKVGPIEITGFVRSVEKLEEKGGSRIVLSDLEIERFSREDTPRKVRLRLRADEGVVPGQYIRALALLNPPSSPVYPGGFDFRRYMFFKEIGAVGFIYKSPEIIEDAGSFSLSLEALRQNVAKNILSVLDGDTAGVAIALMVGQKGGISSEIKEEIRDSGLAHMLAISGLHIGVFAGTVFFVIRFFLSTSEVVSLRYSSKKIAAVFAIFGAVFYMLLAGMTVPTQRAVLMSSIVFMAIIFDRSPISLRLVAFSAVVVLLFRPESLLSASFQMSFAAVTGLIFFFDVTRSFWLQSFAQKSVLKKGALYFLGVCATTVVASLATAPFSLYHFGQVSFLGSVSNLVAVPIFTFIVMPFALISLIFMLFDLHMYPLFIMGGGVDAILDISHWASTVPYAALKIPAWSFLSFVLFIVAMLWGVIWKGYGKVLFIPLFLVSYLSWDRGRPDIMLSSSHDLSAFYLHDGLYVTSLRKDRFTRENWEVFYGLEEREAIGLRFKGKNSQKDGDFKCGEFGCRLHMKGMKVSYINHPYPQGEECVWADILVSAAPVRNKDQCSSVVFDKFSTWKGGAHSVFITDDQSIFVKTVRGVHGHRPWSIIRD